MDIQKSLNLEDGIITSEEAKAPRDLCVFLVYTRIGKQDYGSHLDKDAGLFHSDKKRMLSS